MVMVMMMMMMMMMITLSSKAGGKASLTKNRGTWRVRKEEAPDPMRVCSYIFLRCTKCKDSQCQCRL